MQICDVSVPGKVMLSGEYSVLAGGQALSATVDAQMLVRVCSHDEATIEVASDLWAERWLQHRDSAGSDAKANDPLIKTIMKGLDQYQLPGTKVAIKSDLKLEYGIGSSSAMRLGVLYGMSMLSDLDETGSDCPAFMQISYDLQREHQQRASGYDLITQYCGGLVLSRPLSSEQAWPGEVASLRGAATALHDFVSIYVGTTGTPTGPAMRETLGWIDQQSLMPRLDEAAERLSQAILDHLQNNETSSWNELLQATVNHRSLLADSPTFPRHLSLKLRDIPGCDHTWTYKTTGAGGEDALLIFSETPEVQASLEAEMKKLGWQLAPFRFCETGLTAQLSHGEVSHES